MRRPVREAGARERGGPSGDPAPEKEPPAAPRAGSTAVRGIREDVRAGRPSRGSPVRDVGKGPPGHLRSRTPRPGGPGGGTAVPGSPGTGPQEGAVGRSFRGGRPVGTRRATPRENPEQVRGRGAGGADPVPGHHPWRCPGTGRGRAGAPVRRGRGPDSGPDTLPARYRRRWCGAAGRGVRSRTCPGACQRLPARVNPRRGRPVPPGSSPPHPPRPAHSPVRHACGRPKSVAGFHGPAMRPPCVRPARPNRHRRRHGNRHDRETPRPPRRTA